MKFKKTISMLCAAVLIFIVPLAAYADSAPVMVQTYIDEENIDIFLSDSLDGRNLTVKIADQTAKIFDYGSLADKSIPVRTTILVDVSASIPLSVRSKVIEFVKYKIENIAENEQISIITFDSETTVIQDFTSDRYDLDKAASTIKFNSKKSAVYDAIYKTIPKVDVLDDKPCFYHTIVMTDGADRTEQGVTKEELLAKLQAEPYPIDVICVSKTKPPAQNKDLSDLAKSSSGGRYFDIYPEADATLLFSDVSVSDYYWIRAEIPAALFDGSIRQIDVSDETIHISFSMKMPIADVTAENPDTSESDSSPALSVQQPVSSPAATAQTVPPVLGDGDEQNARLDTAMLIIVIVAAAAVLAVIVIISVIIHKAKKKRLQSEEAQNSCHTNGDAGIAATELIKESESKEHYSIKISNTANQDDWILNVFSDIIIGRAKECAVIIDEKSVSREQCKIAASKSGLVISNLSSSNKTKLNGVILAAEVPLRPADNIHFGRVKLRVDYIQKITDETLRPRPVSTNNTDVEATQSIF